MRCLLHQVRSAEKQYGRDGRGGAILYDVRHDFVGWDKVLY
ncbi:MAG TPA: hypothetical protein VJO16_07920 [Candidatus Acidoferrum sp.]|nr:hypothetical protein [Candidatus Acidoferrum sp.]